MRGVLTGVIKKCKKKKEIKVACSAKHKPELTRLHASTKSIQVLNTINFQNRHAGAKKKKTTELKRMQLTSQIERLAKAFSRSHNRYIKHKLL